MIKKTKYLSYIKVGSDLEAILLEAKLVKKTKPKFNSQLKDDKHPLYIRITKEKYPRVLTARSIDEKEKNIAFFGPFPSSRNVRSVLKMLRKIFPYSTHKSEKRKCLYSQIDLCSPCPSEIKKEKSKKAKNRLKKEYLQNIHYIKRVLSGNLYLVKDSLERKMQKLSNKKDFESAANLRDKIERLDYITQPITPVDRFVENPNLIEDIREDELKSLKRIISKHKKIKTLKRIECFDVAHLAGVKPTASMVTFINGEPDKSCYRHFKIRQKKGWDDVASMGEVAKRRAKYLADWGVPDIIIVDGGKTQVSAFLKVFSKEKIPVVGITKRQEKLVIPVSYGSEKTKFEIIKLKGPALNLVQRLRDEAHRFARYYHHKLLQKSLLPDKK